MKIVWFVLYKYSFLLYNELVDDIPVEEVWHGIGRSVIF